MSNISARFHAASSNEHNEVRWRSKAANHGCANHLVPVAGEFLVSHAGVAVVVTVGEDVRLGRALCREDMSHGCNRGVLDFS